MDFSNKVAPIGHVYQCPMCGKRSRDLYGDQKIDRGWDESCILHAVLVEDCSPAAPVHKT